MEEIIFFIFLISHLKYENFINLFLGIIKQIIYYYYY